MKNMINYILNMIYFIKLLFIIKQLKDQVNSEIISNIIINIEIKKILINKNIINYNKIYINIIIFINIFIFYIIIHDFHDIDNLSFSLIIFLYIR